MIFMCERRRDCGELDYVISSLFALLQVESSSRRFSARATHGFVAEQTDRSKTNSALRSCRSYPLTSTHCHITIKCHAINKCKIAKNVKGKKKLDVF